MAVVRVFGTVDGAEVILTHAGGDRWSVPVPFDIDGEYVVEIIAEDEAGNRSYMAKMLFVVNAALLCVHIVPLPYVATLQEEAYQAALMPRPYALSVQASAYVVEALRPRYYTELIEPVCSLTGRRTSCREYNLN